MIQNKGMAIRFGFLSVAHMHSWGYASGLARNAHAEMVGVWDDNDIRASDFAKLHQMRAFASASDLLEEVDAVVITSENKRHADLVEMAAAAGKHILCEKPLATSEEEGERILTAAERFGVKLMTAFPCRFSPAFQSLLKHVRAGGIGDVRAVCATNRGTCPFDWFVDPSLSGGGAMIDHTVHVADLLRVLLGCEVDTVAAQIGNNMYGQGWEDTAMLTLTFQNGTVATLDSSWSRPKAYKTWGDVTMNVVGDKGTIELDMFNQQLDVYSEGAKSHTIASFGSDLDYALVSAFVDAILKNEDPPVTGFDGLQAARVAFAGYRSTKLGEPVHLSA